MQEILKQVIKTITLQNNKYYSYVLHMNYIKCFTNERDLMLKNKDSMHSFLVGCTVGDLWSGGLSQALPNISWKYLVIGYAQSGPPKAWIILSE